MTEPLSRLPTLSRRTLLAGAAAAGLTAGMPPVRAAGLRWDGEAEIVIVGSGGAGVSAADMRGSEHNDPFYFADGKVRTRRNNSGGIQGGITNGMPLLLRTAFKPTPSIAKEQDTVDLATGENVKLSIVGRHDPCVVVRAVPVVEAVTARVLLDVLREDGRL